MRLLAGTHFLYLSRPQKEEGKPIYMMEFALSRLLFLGGWVITPPLAGRLTGAARPIRVVSVGVGMICHDGVLSYEDSKRASC